MGWRVAGCKQGAGDLNVGYENFIATPGRDDLINTGEKKDRRARHRISLSAIRFRYRRRVMGKGIPADHWENIANGGFQLVYGSTVNLFMKPARRISGLTAAEAANWSAYQSRRHSWQLPWGQSGSPACSAPCSATARSARTRRLPDRGLPRQSAPHPEQFAKDHGLHMRHGTEPEMMWLRKDEARQPERRLLQPLLYHIDQFESCARST